MSKYLDQLFETKHKENIWQKISFLAFTVVACQAIGLGMMSYALISNIDRIRYMIAPGVQALTVVRPGELPSSYIEQSFIFVTEKLNSWSFESIKDNYKTLFEHFYAHDLTTRTQASLAGLQYFEDVEKRKIVSLWKIKPEESEFHWCGNVSMRRESKGVACGIVTGEQKLFADFNVPVSTKDVSYLIYAINVAPTPNNFFAVQIMRLKRGPLKILKSELEMSLKDGVLPLEEEITDEISD